MKYKDKNVFSTAVHKDIKTDAFMFRGNIFHIGFVHQFGPMHSLSDATQGQQADLQEDQLLPLLSHLFPAGVSGGLVVKQ